MPVPPTTTGPRVTLEPADWRGLVGGVRRTRIATGHQAWLWHPGIYAKYAAAEAFARAWGGEALHVVVDHDAYHPWSLDLPFVDGDRLRAVRFRATPERVGAPAYTYPGVEPSGVVDRLHALVREEPGEPGFDVDALADWWGAAPRGERLLDQAVALLAARVPGYGARAMRTTGLVDEAVLQRMCAEPRRCALAFNRAVAAAPEAGLRPLHVGFERVELPLWAVGRRGRSAVYAESLGPGAATLVSDGRSLDGARPGLFAPRASLLTALMRSRHADLFIHGTGGGVYDRVTERWWGDWVGEALAPMAVVSADVHLRWPVPASTRAARDRAVWWAHHLPHNVDRALGLTTGDAARKVAALATLRRSRDGRVRRAAFDELHRLNAALARAHPEAIDGARRAVREAETGRRNAALLARRDWCFALYAERSLNELERRVSPE